MGYHPEITVNRPVKTPNPESKFDKLFADIDKISSRHYDAIVIGSGCGGGVIASELVKSGFSVLVLEKGGFYQQKDFREWRETEAFGRSLERGGLATSSDGNIIVLAGACVGGGTAINWCASLDPHPHVMEEWANLGLPLFGYVSMFVLLY